MSKLFDRIQRRGKPRSHSRQSSRQASPGATEEPAVTPGQAHTGRGLQDFDALAREAAQAPDGRPSDAVRRWLEVHPEDHERRGELLQRARGVMLMDSRRRPRAHLPLTPRAVVPRDSGEHGYPLVDPGREPWLARPLLAMEAFSGGGLFTLASALEGNIEVADCEIDRAAVATRKRNRRLLRLTGDPHVSDAHAWRPTTRTPGGIDLLFGGPPCKWASRASALGRSGRERGWSAKDNFFPQVLDWVCDLQPRVGVFENAPTLVETPRYHDFMAQWQHQLRAIGYDSAIHLLAAADFGNPTMRKRAFVFVWPEGAPWGELLRRAPEGSFAEPGSPPYSAATRCPGSPPSTGSPAVAAVAGASWTACSSATLASSAAGAGTAATSCRHPTPRESRDAVG